MKVRIEVADQELPEAWRLAYERDRTSEVTSADPSPERQAARALAAFILTGLAFLALPGTFLGVWNLMVISEHRAATAASTAWIQAHGHAQLFGWVGSFILGISLYVLPKFQGRGLKKFGMVWMIWGLWTTGVADAGDEARAVCPETPGGLSAHAALLCAFHEYTSGSLGREGYLAQGVRKARNENQRR